MSAKVIYASIDILIYIFTGRSRYSLRFYDVSISKVPQKRLHSWPFLRNGLPSLLILDIINYLWTELQAPVM